MIPMSAALPSFSRSTDSPRPRVAILISGRGSNMVALLEKRDSIDADFVGVISSKASAPGLELARGLDVATRVVPGREFKGDRAGYDAALTETLQELGADFIVLAGFMRILTDGFVSAWRGRMVNIHPSLLPLFPGLHPHQQAIDAGVKVSGCTVHFVAPGEVDGGPIAAQRSVPVYATDSAESLAARVLVEEHRLYADTLRQLFNGSLQLREGRVVERESEPRPLV